MIIIRQKIFADPKNLNKLGISHKNFYWKNNQPGGAIGAKETGQTILSGLKSKNLGMNGMFKHTDKLSDAVKTANNGQGGIGGILRKLRFGSK